MLKIEIKTGNAAFHEHEEEFGDIAKREECIRILNEIIQKINRGYDDGKCIDLNGNTVGNWKLG